MRGTGNQSSKPIHPSPNPATLPNEPEQRADDEVKGEGSYSGTRDYEKSVKAYLENAYVEKDARDVAPDNADEARELEKAEEAGRKQAAKTERRKKGK